MKEHNDIFRSGLFVPEPQAPKVEPVKIWRYLRSAEGYLVGKVPLIIPKYTPRIK